MKTKHKNSIGKTHFPRIFKYGMALLFCSVLVMTSCSKDNEIIPEKQQKKVNLQSLQEDQPQRSTLSLVAKSYEEIMDNLYGRGNYAIAEAVKVSDDDSDYDVKVVTKNKVDRGYLIDIDRGQDGIYENTIFVDHSVKNTDNITYYNIKEGIEQGFDLTLDPNYPGDIGFEPTEPPLENFGHPWIGFDESFEYERVGHYGDGLNQCYQYTYSDLYFFGIRVSHELNVNKTTIVDCPEEYRDENLQEGGH